MFFTFQGCASGWTHDPVGRRLWSKKIPIQCLDRAKNCGLWISGLLQAPFYYPTSDTIVKCKNEKCMKCARNGFGIVDDDYYSHFGPNCSLHVELR